jgi:hypothetical protein
MKSLLVATVLLGAIAVPPPPLPADVLLIEELRQAGRMELPENGPTKPEVETRFGKPEIRHSAVGDPPISRWEYKRWSVYFEYNRVLFTVLHKGEVIQKDG